MLLLARCSPRALRRRHRPHRSLLTYTSVMRACFPTATQSKALKAAALRGGFVAPELADERASPETAISYTLPGATWRRALSLFAEMKLRGLQAGPFAYGTAIELCSRRCPLPLRAPPSRPPAPRHAPPAVPLDSRHAPRHPLASRTLHPRASSAMLEEGFGLLHTTIHENTRPNAWSLVGVTSLCATFQRPDLARSILALCELEWREAERRQRPPSSHALKRLGEERHVAPPVDRVRPILLSALPQVRYSCHSRYSRYSRYRRYSRYSRFSSRRYRRAFLAVVAGSRRNNEIGSTRRR